MKNLIKFAGVLVTALAANATILTTNITGAGTNNIIWNSKALIQQVVAINAGTQAVTLALIDAPSNNVYVATGSYTNYTPTVSWYTNTYTSPMGTSVSNAWQVVSNVANVVTGTTVKMPVLVSLLVPTNSYVVYTPPLGTQLIATRGIVLTNKDSVSVSVTYQPGW